MNYGVPQGYIVGPLFFIMNVIDFELNRNSGSNLILDADDNVIKTTARNMELTKSHQKALKKLANCLEEKKTDPK